MNQKFKTPQEVKDYLMTRDKGAMTPGEKKIVDELLLIEFISQHLHNHFTEENLLANFKEQDIMMKILVTAKVAKQFQKKNPGFDPYTQPIPNFGKELREYMLSIRDEGIKSGTMTEEDFDDQFRCEHDQAIHMQISQSMILINQYYDGE